MFRGLVRSQGPKRVVVTEASDRSAGRGATKPDESRRIYFLLDFLVVDFFELFLAAFFFAMALSPPFVGANLRVVKIKVNVFLRPRRFFLDAGIALALPRRPARARANEKNFSPQRRRGRRGNTT